MRQLTLRFVQEEPKAVALEPELEIIDEDLGASASVGAPHRNGFDRLIELVVKKEAGILWQIPPYSFLKDVLQNPHYAYSWGRRQTETVVENGKVRKRQTGVLAREKWKVLLPDHHEGYIDWHASVDIRRAEAAGSGTRRAFCGGVAESRRGWHGDRLQSPAPPYETDRRIENDFSEGRRG